MRGVKRPPLHHVIIIGYILAPFANIALLMVFTGFPLGRILSRLFAGYGYLASVWLITAPLVGVGLYFVHRASWIAFLVHSSLILLDFILKWIIRPRFYLQTIPTLNNLLILLGNLALVGAIGYMIRRDFAAPYFQALKRHWRETERIPIRHRIAFGDDMRDIDDLSRGGCFVVGSGGDFPIGHKAGVGFRLGPLEVQCDGEVMRAIESGYGVRFTGLSGRASRELRRALTRRFSLRYVVDFTGTWQWDGQTREVRVRDLSAGGAYLEMDVLDLAADMRGTLWVSHPSFPERMAAHIQWVNTSAEHHKPVGCGLHFDRRHTRVVRDVVRAGNRTLTR